MTRRKDPPTEAPAFAPAPAAEAVAEPEAGRKAEPAAEPAAELVADIAEPAETAPATVHSETRRTGIVGPVLGGFLAAVAGFGLAQFDVLGLRPAPGPAPDADHDADHGADHGAEIAALTERLSALSETEGGLTALAGAMADLEGRIAALETRPEAATVDPAALQVLGDRLTVIESLPAGEAGPSAALAARLDSVEAALQDLPVTDTAAISAKLDVALLRLAQAEAEAEARAKAATSAAAGIARDQALRQLGQAVASGLPFADELAALADPALDAALGPLADTGMPTLAALQEDFPDAARETLRLSRMAGVQGGWTDRVMDFLASQTEARSLTPRDGDEADAVLSRAEFALAEGRVSDAMTELAALDPAMTAPLGPWQEAARRFLAAQAELAAAGLAILGGE